MWAKKKATREKSFTMLHLVCKRTQLKGEIDMLRGTVSQLANMHLENDCTIDRANDDGKNETYATHWIVEKIETDSEIERDSERVSVPIIQTNRWWSATKHQKKPLSNLIILLPKCGLFTC